MIFALDVMEDITYFNLCVSLNKSGCSQDMG